jgi:hypothetical protein
MATTFLEFSRSTMMPGGGMANTGENIGFDSVAQATFIASVLASGAAVGGSAPSAPSAPALVRVKFTGLAGAVMVGNSPPLLGPGEIAGFPAAAAAALIASGAAVSN